MAWEPNTVVSRIVLGTGPCGGGGGTGQLGRPGVTAAVSATPACATCGFPPPSNGCSGTSNAALGVCTDSRGAPRDETESIAYRLFVPRS